MNQLGYYLQRQQRWSARTFGDGRRTVGIIRHIEKELKEIEADPSDLSEWIDVMILALDGYWRHGGTPHDLYDALSAKQRKNFRRAWPPIGPEDQAMEHVR